MGIDYFELKDPVQIANARQRIEKSRPLIQYSERYADDEFEYRHVTLPKDLAKLIPRNRLMSEAECIHMGVTQSPGWVHYMIHRPEPHVLLFKRPRADAKRAPAAQAPRAA